MFAYPLSQMQLSIATELFSAVRDIVGHARQTRSALSPGPFVCPPHCASERAYVSLRHVVHGRHEVPAVGSRRKFKAKRGRRKGREGIVCERGAQTEIIWDGRDHFSLTNVGVEIGGTVDAESRAGPARTLTATGWVLRARAGGATCADSVLTRVTIFLARCRSMLCPRCAYRAVHAGVQIGVGATAAPCCRALAGRAQRARLAVRFVFLEVERIAWHW